MHGTTALMSSRASENEMPPADHSAGDDGEMGRVGAGTKAEFGIVNKKVSA